MANTKTAIDFVIRQEDSTLSGIITDAPADKGGVTRYGLCAEWHPDLVAKGFFSASMTADEALPMAEEAYSAQYDPQLLLGQVTSDAVATALLSFAVLEGNFEAISLLQNAVVMLGVPIAVDGEMGPATLAAANSCDPQKLLAAVVQLQKTHFAQIAIKDPSQEKWVKGWDNRADALLLITA